MAVESGYNRAVRMPNRREFLKKMLVIGVGPGLACTLGLEMLSGCAGKDEPMDITPTEPRVRPTPTLPPRSHEASFYRRLDDGSIQCGVCWRRCVVPPGKLGFCRGALVTRMVEGGRDLLRYLCSEEGRGQLADPGAKRALLRSTACSRWHRRSTISATRTLRN